MKLLDRYVLAIFLSAIVVFLLAFLSLFLVIDFSSKLARFLTLRTVAFLPFVTEYYACRVPLFLMYVLPTLPLFAAMFTMIKLQKTNEVMPIVAAGVSLRRVALPFVVASMVAAAAIAAIDELALPPLMQRIGETDEILLTEEVSYGRVLYDGRGNHVWVRAYDHVRKTMEDVILTKISPGLRQELYVTARRGRWDAPRRAWVLNDGSMLPYDAQGNAVVTAPPGERFQRKVVPIPAEGYVLESDIIPEDLQRKFTISGQSYSLRELRARLEKAPGEPRLLVLLHSKFTTPLSSVVLLLLGLPFVVQARGKSFFRGLTLCLIVTGAYYVAHLGAMELGKAGRIDANLSAWAAPVLFGLTGLTLFARMRS
jgi:lipopolysaccharide export system permease protein